jgi:hypothetical protein
VRDAQQRATLPGIAGVPDVGALAATADALVAHPLVVAECAKLNAKPVVVPAATPVAAPAPAATPPVAPTSSLPATVRRSFA